MIYRIDVDGEVAQLIRQLHPNRKKKIKQALKAMARDPLQGKPLQEELSGFMSYRVGTLRIIYTIDEKKKNIHIVALGPRRCIYEETEKELYRYKKKLKPSQ